jgi:hypothetical protein
LTRTNFGAMTNECPEKWIDRLENLRFDSKKVQVWLFEMLTMAFRIRAFLLLFLNWRSRTPAHRFASIFQARRRRLH